MNNVLVDLEEFLTSFAHRFEMAYFSENEIDDTITVYEDGAIKVLFCSEYEYIDIVGLNENERILIQRWLDKNIFG